MYKLSKIISIVLASIGVLLWFGLMFFVDRNNPENLPMSLMFYVGYLLFGISIVVAVVSSIINILSVPGAIKQFLTYVGVFAVIVIVSYVFSLGEATPLEVAISTGLIAFYILAGIAILLLVFTGVKNALTK